MTLKADSTVGNEPLDLVFLLIVAFDLIKKMGA